MQLHCAYSNSRTTSKLWTALFRISAFLRIGCFMNSESHTKAVTNFDITNRSRWVNKRFSIGPAVVIFHSIFLRCFLEAFRSELYRVIETYIILVKSLFLSNVNHDFSQIYFKKITLATLVFKSSRSVLGMNRLEPFPEDRNLFVASIGSFVSVYWSESPSKISLLSCYAVIWNLLVYPLYPQLMPLARQTTAFENLTFFADSWTPLPAYLQLTSWSLLLRALER